MRVFKGIAVSPGLVIARVFLLDDARHHLPRRSVPSGSVAAEQARLIEALAASRKDLAALRTQAEGSLGGEAAKIFAFHEAMLADRTLVDLISKRIATERVTAEFAAQEEFRALADRFAGMRDNAIRTKVDDVWDLERRVVRRLIGAREVGLAALDHEAVVIARDLTPTQTSQFQRSRVLGFATDTGGLTSHTAIFARALEIPAVVGVGPLTEAAENGDTVILDGDRGEVVLRPTPEAIEEYRGYIEKARVFALSLTDMASLDSVTRDGVKIDLHANIEFADEIADALGEHGGDGVGLFRTEFLWLTSDHEPTEEEQFEHYKRSVELAGGKPLTIRTFDLGADKYTQERAESPERNPFLGCRSIRYCLQDLPMFRRQLRAIMRASAFGPIRVMFPLVSNTTEYRQAKMILNDVMDDLADEGVAFDRGVKVGIMVETPAAALMAHIFAREADFLSIGTNDLVQYTLAVDRTNEKVAGLYTASSPAVIMLVKDVIRAARRHHKPVSCCGEIAGDPEYALLLIGLGLRTLSMTPSRIPNLKRVVRSVDIATCEKLARTVGSFDSETLVSAYLRDQARKIIPDAIGGRSAD